MSAAFKFPTANDNLPSVPVPAQPVPQPVGSHPASDIDQGREGLLALLLVWTLTLGATVGLAPGGLALTAVMVSLATVAAAMIGMARHSHKALGVAALAWGAAAILALVLPSTPIATMVWPLLLGSLWIVIAGSCIRSIADIPAGLLGLGLGAVGVTAVVATTSLSTGLALGAAGGFLYLGLSRAMVKRDVMTAGAHYIAAWTLVAACAAVLFYFGEAPSLSPEMVVVMASFGAFAFILWAVQGVYPAVQAAIILAIATLFALPELEARLAAGTQLAFPDQPLALLLGLSALFAAGAAMSIRGIRAGRLDWAILGTSAALATLFIASQPAFMTLENAVILGLAAMVTTTGLLAARIR